MELYIIFRLYFNTINLSILFVFVVCPFCLYTIKYVPFARPCVSITIVFNPALCLWSNLAINLYDAVYMVISISASSVRVNTYLNLSFTGFGYILGGPGGCVLITYVAVAVKTGTWFVGVKLAVAIGFVAVILGVIVYVGVTVIVIEFAIVAVAVTHINGLLVTIAVDTIVPFIASVPLADPLNAIFPATEVTVYTHVNDPAESETIAVLAGMGPLTRIAVPPPV